MNAGEVDRGLIGQGRGQLSRLEVVLAVLVAELELREAELLQKPFVPLQGMLFLHVVGAAVRRALVNRAVGLLLPAVEGAVAIGAPVTSLGRAEARRELRQATADLAVELRGPTTIVEVKEIAGSTAMRAAASGGESATATALDRPQGPTVEALVIEAQLLPVQLRPCGREGGWLRKRRLGIDIKIAVVRMLLAEVVAGMNCRPVPGQHLLQLLDEFLQIAAGEFSAEPKDQSWYLAHGGESLRNLVSSAHQGLRRETSPPFSFPVKPYPTRSALQLGRSTSTPIRSKAGGESRDPSSPQQVKQLSA
jgi:hypothetical protein